MKSLCEYIKHKDKITIEFSENFNEEYEFHKNDITIHGENRFTKGDNKTGGIIANIEEIKNIIYRCDSYIENYMLNRKQKTSNCKCGIQIFNKDKSSLVIVGEIYNFNYKTCTYRFKLFTGRKFLHYNKWKFYRTDELKISNDNDKLKIEII